MGGRHVTISDAGDHRELTALVSLLYAVLDERRFDELDTVYSHDAVLDFPTARMVGLAEIERVARRRADRYGEMQHFTTDVLVQLDGDRATLRTNHLAVHVHRRGGTSEHYDAGVVHHFEARRTPVGWRLCRGRAQVVWTSGQPA